MTKEFPDYGYAGVHTPGPPATPHSPAEDDREALNLLLEEHETICEMGDDLGSADYLSCFNCDWRAPLGDEGAERRHVTTAILSAGYHRETDEKETPAIEWGYRHSQGTNACRDEAEARRGVESTIRSDEHRQSRVRGKGKLVYRTPAGPWIDAAPTAEQTTPTNNTTALAAKPDSTHKEI